MYQALYRKYRPKTLSEIAGQDVIVRILTNAINNNQISHAYLFCGPRGTGKTSIAKIIAKIINCSDLKDMKPCDKCQSCIEFNQKSNTDIIEIDAASNNGVDEIRELKNKINLVPNLGKYKIYIIDEVHMLTIGAFNALLKTLEEPPAHAIFILATTEPHKIPITILSRCQRLDFKKISQNAIYERLRYICDEEKINATNESLIKIASLCDGGMRDSISMLDKLLAYTNNNIDASDVIEINGLVSNEELEELLNLIDNKNYKMLFEVLEKYNSNGKNFSKLCEELILCLRNKMVLEIESNNNINNVDRYVKYINVFNDIITQIKNCSNQKVIMETNLIKLMASNDENKKEKKPEKETFKQETKKIVKIETYENKKEAKKELDEDYLKNLEKLKIVRINNTLSKFDKKKIIEYKKQLEKIDNFIIDPDYSDLAGIILDGNLKAASEENAIFIYESSNVAIDFNCKILQIENLLDKINLKIKVIATDIDEWEEIKKEYNSKTKKYNYNDDQNLIKMLFNSTESNQKNSIETMFDDIIKYDK